MILGVVLGMAFKVLMKAVVMPMLGADPINHAYHYMVGNTGALPGMLLAIVVGAGFGEETLFRGYMFERLRKLLGTRAIAHVLIVLITAGLFGLAHYPEQGLAGVQQAGIVGLVFGVIFAFTGQLWMLMCAHAAFDLAALAIIYRDLESYVAHCLQVAASAGTRIGAAAQHLAGAHAWKNRVPSPNRRSRGAQLNR